MEISQLELLSIQYRKTILSIIMKANAGHTGGSLSCIDILNVLYNHVMNVSPENIHDRCRDRYIHSKGHSVEALYTVLADRGFFPLTDLDSMEKFQSPYLGHPTRKVNGIEHNTGALGHGLSVAVGMALAGKIDALPYRVYAILGDGELTEGSVWEASMSAANYHLDNLVVIIDRNMLQITGKTEDIMRLEPLTDKFEAFGFAVRSIDGNNIGELVQIFEQIPFSLGKPNLILARTTKGKGVSFIENKVLWHHHVPTGEQYIQAIEELDLAEKNLREKYETVTVG